MSSQIFCDKNTNRIYIIYIYKAKVPFLSRVNSATTAPMEAIQSLCYWAGLCQVSGFKIDGRSFAQKRSFNSSLYKE